MIDAPPATVGRLVLYVRVLDEFVAKGLDATSSDAIAEAAGVTAFQVRKDLSHVGPVGQRGKGYDVHRLQQRIRSAIGLDGDLPVVIVGMGRLGQALAHYPNLGGLGARVVATFDADPGKIGGRVGGWTVRAPSEMSEVARAHDVQLAFLTVPGSRAAGAARLIARAGIPGILNFSSSVIDAPDGTIVESVDFLTGLGRLAHRVRLASKTAAGPPRPSRHDDAA
jgi:redox-sensing transcriptional repressor